MNQGSTHQPDNELPDDIVQRAVELIEREAVPPVASAALIAATLRVLTESGECKDRPVQ